MAARPPTRSLPALTPAPRTPFTPAWAPLNISTLLGTLQGHWGLQAGSLQRRVPQLQWGINTCGGGGESRVGWEAPVAVRPPLWGGLSFHLHGVEGGGLKLADTK